MKWEKNMDMSGAVQIEIDNVRACAAYKKGLDDLLKIWPAIVAMAEKEDAPYLERRRVEKEKADEAHKKYLEQMAEYQKTVREWEEMPSSFWGKGERPLVPESVIFDQENLRRSPYHPTRIEEPAINRFLRVKNELEHNRDVASGAMRPYAVNPVEAARMVQWENGTTIAAIIERNNITAIA
jgi:hypothetical protein